MDCRAVEAGRGMQPVCPVGETPTCSPDKFEWLSRDHGPNLAHEAFAAHGDQRCPFQQFHPPRRRPLTPARRPMRWRRMATTRLRTRSPPRSGTATATSSPWRRRAQPRLKARAPCSRLCRPLDRAGEFGSDPRRTARWLRWPETADRDLESVCVADGICKIVRRRLNGAGAFHRANLG